MFSDSFFKHSTHIKSEIKQALNKFKNIGFSESGILIDALTEYCLRGKMMRGCLTVETARRFGAENLEKAYKVAASIELLHSGILMADDIIDRDEKRRGLPSMHIMMESIFLKEGKKNRNVTGEDLAMAVSLTTTYIGFHVLSETSNELLNIVADAFSKTGFAELKELLVSVGDDFKEEDVLKVYELKTGIYSICLPIKAGLSLALRKDLFETAEKAGIYAGLAFQIKDDLLELESPEEIAGKPQFSDFRVGRKNYPLTLLYTIAETDEKQQIEKIFFSGGAKSTEQINYILYLMKKHRLKDLLYEKIEDYGRLAISHASQDRTLAGIIQELIEFNRSRNK